MWVVALWLGAMCVSVLKSVAPESLSGVVAVIIIPGVFNTVIGSVQWFLVVLLLWPDWVLGVTSQDDAIPERL